MTAKVQIKRLGELEYEHAYDAMCRFTDERNPDTDDQIWLLEHPPVFTLGINAAASHVLDPGEIPVVQADRGGQVTYHGPGQLVVYPLVNLRRARLGIRELVSALEDSVILTLRAYGIVGTSRRTAPGVYVGDAKIASVGLRVRRGCSYHGLALNVATDLGPFDRIDPCGFEGLQLTRTLDLGGPSSVMEVADDLVPNLLRTLGLGSDTDNDPIISSAARPATGGVPTSQHPSRHQ